MLKKEELIEYMENEAVRPLDEEEIAAAFHLDLVEEVVELKKMLLAMEQEGELIRTRKNRYGLPGQLGLLVGRIQRNIRGFGFLLQDDPFEEDVFIGVNDLKGAVNDDRVIVRLKKPAIEDARSGIHYRAEGEVMRIIKRGNTKIMGTLELHKSYGYVIPDDRKFPGDIFIPKDGLNGGQNGDKVIVDIRKWPEQKRNAQGKICEIIGKKSEVGMDVISVMYKYNLPQSFPEEVIQAAENCPSAIMPEELCNRKDLREELIITIDGEDAKDLDDAVSLQVLDDGLWRLGVHIADVSHYVKEDGILDKEAFARGTSVYLVDRVLPMLPQRLSNGICSLNAGEDRLAVSIYMDIDCSGIVTSHEIMESVIRVRHRMSYRDVNEILAEEDSPLKETYADIYEMLQQMAGLQDILYHKRLYQGALDFQFPESKVKLDENGKPTDIICRYRGKAERIIEEFMLCANQTIAERYFWLEAPFLYRIHDEPKSEDIMEMNQFLQIFGYSMKYNGGRIHSKAYQKVLKRVKGAPEESAISMVMLRSMNHARYAAYCSGHFGLAAEYYTHFTSPIRRYPDLIVHRMIKELLHTDNMLGAERKKYLQEKMPEYAEQASVREKIAEEAERESVDMKKVEYMLPYVGEVFDAMINGVTSYGFFVELSNSVNGLVHVSTLVDDFYHFSTASYSLVGENTRRKFQLGQKIKVKLIRVDVDDRQLDFEYVKE